MKLVVIIPALNEERTVAEMVRRVPRQIAGVDEVEVIVVDDGSTDRTVAEARQAGALVVSHPYNRGLGVAFKTGIEEALRRDADVIINMDADGQFSPEDIPALAQPILDGRAEFVTCTRFLKKEWIPDMPWTKLWGNRIMTRVVNHVTRSRPKLSDVSCGFRAYAREAAFKLNTFGVFTYTQESIIDLASKDVRMAEVPLRVRGEREHGKSRIARSLYKYGRNAGLILLRSARDLHPLRFFGSLGAAAFIVGALAGAVVAVNWLVTGATHPFKSLIIVSGAAFIVSLLLFVLALLADMMGTLLKTLDKVRMELRRSQLGERGRKRPADGERG
jgi:glycosyltransferase involved in cell wall biosynthesis